jgi:potassium uptake TrkH family protein
LTKSSVNHLKFFSNPDRQLRFLKKFKKGLERIIRYTAFLAFFILIRQLGYDEGPIEEIIESNLFTACLFLIGLASSLKIFVFEHGIRRLRLGVELFLSLLLIFAAFVRIGLFPEEEFGAVLNFFHNFHLINVLVILLFFIELSKLSVVVNRLKLSPSLVFITSFLILILVGAALLSLPAATPNGISVVDAFFTSVSAVCVTGLIVLDTSSDFTYFGQTVIMILFQIGGLGMMTFTSFFGFFFRGSFSFESQLFLRDYINENNVGRVYGTLFKIIVFTILVEGIVALIIYNNVSPDLFISGGDHVFFAVFHAVSAFCNAGFSTLSNGLYEAGFRDAYTMHLGVIMAILLGGIGFPVVLSYYNYAKETIKRFYRKLRGYERYKHQARVSNITTRLVMYTTGALLLLGFVVYLIAEQDATLKGLSPYGKFVTALFGTVTPRTAGFNTVDMSQLAMPTVLFYLILMWIGASPGSTGGGLKTSTFAVAVLNTLSVAAGKKRVEVFGREIAPDSIQKAFAVIALSFLIIGLGVFLIMIFNPELALVDVSFEVFSAFSTVGLSLGITGSLSSASKIVLMVIMFIGRVGSLTILVAVIRKVGNQNYAYPKENIIIT